MVLPTVYRGIVYLIPGNDSRVVRSTLENHEYCRHESTCVVGMV